MSWSTELFCNISFHKQTYNHLSEVTSKIEELKDYKQILIDQLFTLVVTTEPNKLYEFEGNVADFLRTEFKEIVEALEETISELNDLYYLKENWSLCHDSNGNAIKIPDELCDKAYISGDFIE